MKNHKKQSGLFMSEAVISLGLVILLAATITIAMRFYGIVNRCQLARQQCIATVQAQLDSLMMQKKPLSADEIQRLWPGVVCTIEKQPGRDTWKKLELVTVTATTKVYKRQISVRMNRYIQHGEQ